MNNINLIFGNEFEDRRGKIKFINDFTFESIKRFYIIEPEIGLIRAWQGHLKEKKWFCLLKGNLEIRLINMNDFDNRISIALSDSDFKIIEIPNGFYNGFISYVQNTQLLVFSNFTLEQSNLDDHRKTLNELPWV